MLNVMRQTREREVTSDAGHEIGLHQLDGIVAGGRRALPRGAAGKAVAAYMTAQVDAILGGDRELQRGTDPIHDTRVAIRRLRSTLRVFGTALDTAAVDDMDTELTWFAGLLGEVRDSHVQQRRFTEAVSRVPVDDVLGPVAATIADDLRSTEIRARKVVTEAMETPRYQALVSTLRLWAVRPPLATVKAKTVRRRAKKAKDKADTRLTEAIEVGDDEQLHRARKASKRARYAAELLTPISTSAAKDVKRYKKIQSALGDHQDSAVAAATIRRLGVTAGTTPGQNGFTFGMLYDRELQAAEKARRAARKLL